MTGKKQARKSKPSALAIKQKMLLRRLSVRGLASQVGHHESVVSKAINHGRFPRVREKIVEVLAP